jgi:hypothetical protein
LFELPYGLTPIPEKFDAIIPVSQKDFTKLPFAVEQLFKNVPIDTVYIVSPTPVYEEEAAKASEYNVVFFDDQDILPIDANIFKPRTSWVYLQWIKLQTLQNITKSDWFITLDADLFVLKPLPFVVDGKPGVFYARDKDKIIGGYGNFTAKMLGFPWNEFSLMNDIALYNKDVIRAMIDHVGGHDAFIDRAAEICEQSCFPSDAQLHYAWIQKEYPDLYELRTVSNGWRGMYWSYEFSTEDVRKTIALGYSGGVDTFSLHSWGTQVGKQHSPGSYSV